MINCKNCGYEIDEASSQGYCDNCERAYQLGNYCKMSEAEILTLLESQESYSNKVESDGAYAATTLELITGILALDPENDEEYNDYALVDMIELVIQYHRNHKDKD
jgi:hypothetical protein